MGNPFKKTTTAVTSKGNPFRTSNAETALRDSALSPLLEEPATQTKRITTGAGPRIGIGAGVAPVVTSAPAPKEFEKRLARAIAQGTKRAAPFGAEAELTEEQALSLARAKGAVAISEDIGRSIAGQPARTLYRTATGIARLRNDPRATRLAEQTREIEESTAPQTGFGEVTIPLPKPLAKAVGVDKLPINLLRAGAEMGAFIPSGVAMGALRSGVESAAGKEFSTVGRNIDDPLTRALADAAFDLAIPGALAAPRTYRAARGAVDLSGLGDAFTQGIREGAPEAAESVVPSLARKDGYAPRSAPETQINRLLTAKAQAGSAQPLFRMPPIPEAVAEAPAAPQKTGRRTAADVLARRPEFEMPAALAAEPDEVAAYAAGKPVGEARVARTPIEQALMSAEEARRVRNINVREGIGSPSELRERLRKTGIIGGRAENTPDLATMPDDVLKQAEQEALGEARVVGAEPPQKLQDMSWEEIVQESNKKVSLPKMTDEQLQDILDNRAMRVAELEAIVTSWDEQMTGVIESFKAPARSPNMTRAMRSKATRENARRNPVTGELYETAAEKKQRERGITDENLARLEEAGFADRDDFIAQKKAVDKARLALNPLRKSAYLAQVEYVRRFNEGVRSGRIDGELMPEPINPSAKKPPRTPPSGRVSPAVVQGLGGFGAGATVGLGADEEGGMSPLQRALLYGAAGAAGGVGLGRVMRGKVKPPVSPSIPELSPMMGTINTGKRTVAEEAPGMLGRAQRAYSKLVSETFPLEEAARRFGTTAQSKELPALVAQKQGSGRAAESYLFDNLSPLLRTLSEEEKQSVRGLLKSRRDLQIRQRGGAAKSDVPTDVLERGVAAGNADPKIAAVADRVAKMHRELLEMRYKAGLLSEEAYDAIKKSDDFYTPLYREIAEDGGPVRTTNTLPGARSGKFNIFSSGVRRMDRTAEAFEQTADPLEMVVADAARTYRDVAKQRVANVIFSLADANKMVGSNGLPLIERIQADPLRPPKGPDVLQQIRNGKLYTYRINDKDLMAALSAQDNVANNAFVKFASILKNIQTAGITVLPDFASVNVIRDVAMSGVQRPDVARAVRGGALGALTGGVTGAVTADSPEDAFKRFMQGAGLGVGVGLYTKPLMQTLTAVGQIVGNKQVYRDFLASGGSTEGFAVRNANDAAQILKNLEKGPGFSVSDILIPTNWWQTLRKIGSVGEQATRVAAFKQATEAGMSGAEAALVAQDRTLRFAKSGGSNSVKSIAAMTPFWNAKVQGWDKLARMMKDPKTYPLAAGMLTAPTLALWSINKDNPEYWERPVYERNLFWLIPKSVVGNEGEKGFWRIPKPFELGFMFASLPERALDYAAQAGLDLPFFGEIQNASPQVAEPGRALKRSAADMAAATFEGTLPVPEVASLPAQLYMNKDVFRNRPIVTRPQLSPELQVTNESSAIARALAKAGVSPEKTDFFIRNAFGTAGAEASKAIDVAARAAGIPASEPPAGLARIPFVGRFAERFSTSTKGQTDPEALARERLRELTQIEVDYKELKRIGDQERLVNFAEKHMDDLDLAKRIQPLETELEKLSRLRTKIRKDNSYSPEDRKIALDILRQRGQALSETLIGVPKQ